MATFSNYSDQLPAGSYPIRNTDELLRSNFSIVARALDTESYFTSASASSASAGIMRPGSARVFFGTRSALATPSSADSAGRLYFATDTGALLYLAASSASTIAGGSAPDGARFAVASAISVGAATADIAFGTNVFRSGAFAATAANPTVTVPLTGRYAISVGFRLLNSGSSYCGIDFFRNGAQDGGAVFPVLGGGGFGSFSDILDLTSGDTLSVKLSTFTGTLVNTSSYFAIQRIV